MYVFDVLRNNNKTAALEMGSYRHLVAERLNAACVCACRVYTVYCVYTHTQHIYSCADKCMIIIIIYILQYNRYRHRNRQLKHFNLFKVKHLITRTNSPES